MTIYFIGNVDLSLEILAWKGEFYFEVTSRYKATGCYPKVRQTAASSVSGVCKNISSMAEPQSAVSLQVCLVQTIKSLLNEKQLTAWTPLILLVQDTSRSFFDIAQKVYELAAEVTRDMFFFRLKTIKHIAVQRAVRN